MSQTIPALVLRDEAGSELTTAQMDGNFRTLSNFANSLAAQVAAAVTPDGTLIPGSVGTDSLADRAVTQTKLALDALPYYVDESLELNAIKLFPDPAMTEWVVGSVFFVHIPALKQPNTGPMRLEVNDLTEENSTAAQLVRPGRLDLEPQTIQSDSVIMLVCVTAEEGVPAQVMLVSGGARTALAGQAIYNGSFENRSGDLADGWTLETYVDLAGGVNPPEVAGTVEMAEGEAAHTRHGGRAVKFTMPTHSGGTINLEWPALVGSTYYACAEAELVRLAWLFKLAVGDSANVDIPIHLALRWYDHNKAALATPATDLWRVVYKKVGDPAAVTSWTRMTGELAAPVGARFFQVELGFGRSETVPTAHNNATAWFDDVRFYNGDAFA